MMESEKRKRTGDGEVADGKRGKTRKEEEYVDAVKGVPPGDDEVEEFFAILRRIRVAVNYFQKRNGGREMTVTHCSPPSSSFRREDLNGVNRGSEKVEENIGDTGLDLNSDPAVSDE